MKGNMMPSKSAWRRYFLVTVLFFVSATAPAQDEFGLLWKEARIHGWKPKGITSDGRTFELVAVENNRPIYYITNNAIAADVINTNMLHDPNFYDPPLDGNDMTIGIWDAGWVLNTHQEFDSRVTIMDGIVDVNDPNAVFGEHATNVAGTIGAKGVQTGAKGMAPNIKMNSYDWGLDTTEMAENGSIWPADTGKICLSNHSYGIISGWQHGIFKAILGDFNNDDIVDKNDLYIFSIAWLSTPDSNNWNPICDVSPFPDGDEIVNFFDYALMANNWGKFMVAQPYWFGKWGELEDRSFGYYSTYTALWDELCHTTPYYLPFKAAGNDRGDDNDKPDEGTEFWYLDPNEPNEPGDPNFGWWINTVFDSNDANMPYNDRWDDGGFDTIPIISAAKNIITIGAVDDTNDMTSFSGWGPTDDGRIKPDVMANGYELYTTSAVNDVNYATYSGTSASCASAAGSAALLVQLRNQLLPAEPMRSSTLKALIIHTAKDVGLDGPDYKYGWGLMDANLAADYIVTDYDDANGVKILEGAITSGTTINYTFNYDGNNPSLWASLSWTDPADEFMFGLPGDINDLDDANQTILDNNTPKLINDLDLRIINKDDPNFVYFPFALEPNEPNSPAAPNDNFLDNVEQVRIDPGPAVGDYIVQISHKGEISGIVQFYSLISSEPIPIRKIWVDDNSEYDPVPYVPDPAVGGPKSDPAEDGTFEHPFDAIQKAINDANDQDIVVAKDGIYTGIGNYDMDALGKAITIRKHREDPDAVCTIDCRSQGRAINFRNGEVPTTRLDGFIITNGLAEDPTWPSIPDENDTPQGFGGAIYCKGASPWINDCIIQSNLAQYGGGAVFCDAGSNPLIMDCELSFNICDSNGVYFEFDTDIYDMNLGGGGIYCNNSSPAIYNCLIADNDADGSGGGIFCRNSDAFIYNSILYKNDCWANNDYVFQYGGGIYCEDSSPVVYNCLLERNHAAWSGGAVFASGGAEILDINDITPAQDYLPDVNNIVQIAGCVIIDNACWGSGGGICAAFDDCFMAATNCLIANNWGYWSGGASSDYGSMIRLANCTIADNVASWKYYPNPYLIGGLECDIAAGRVIDSIIWDNSGAQIESNVRDVNDPNIVTGLMVTYSDVGMVDPNGQGPDYSSIWRGTGNINTDPLFADAIRGDYHLKTSYHNGRYNPQTGRFDRTDNVTSPCINTGDPWADFRFEPAPNGRRVNMGAYGNTRQASRHP